MSLIREGTKAPIAESPIQNETNGWREQIELSEIGIENSPLLIYNPEPFENFFAENYESLSRIDIILADLFEEAGVSREVRALAEPLIVAVLDRVKEGPEALKAFADAIAAGLSNLDEKQTNPTGPTFQELAPLDGKPRASSSDLDKEVADLENVKAARRLVRRYERQPNATIRTAVEQEQLRAARRLVRASERRVAPTNG